MGRPPIAKPPARKLWRTDHAIAHRRRLDLGAAPPSTLPADVICLNFHWIGFACNATPRLEAPTLIDFALQFQDPGGILGRPV
jgi:hypothetical protein